MSSGVGRFPDDIDDILKPLKQKVTETPPSRISGQRRKLAYFLLMDAMASAHAIELVVKAPVIFGTPLQPDAIEPLVRHVVEKSIVAAYVATQPDGSVVDRFLKTSANEFDKSFRTKENHPHADLPVKELPTYRQMGEQSCPHLWLIYCKLSWISHPRSALPYSMQALSSRDPAGFSVLRCAKALEWLDEALKVLLASYEEIDAAPSGDEDARSDYFLSKNEVTTEGLFPPTQQELRPPRSRPIGKPRRDPP